MAAHDTILVINCGSSSIKFAVFSAGGNLRRIVSGEAGGIGTDAASLRTRDAGGGTPQHSSALFSDHKAALAEVVRAIATRSDTAGIMAVGHRVVHGGEQCDCPVEVTPAIEERLRKLAPLAPLHLPHNLSGIAAARELHPGLPQIACFDTAFHRTLPRLATLLPLPRDLREAGIRRYGFHGLSYEYVVADLRRRGVNLERERIIIAHLGNGASMCALLHGRSVETTMGFSTLAGLVMGTRCGDLDPGVVLYLLSERGLDHEQIEALLYQRSGLLGVSGTTSDMRELLAHQSDPAAREAIDLFCYRARHHLVALTAALNGLDRIVFTGGIGANAPEVRDRICVGLSYLGVTLDVAANSVNAAIISEPNASVTVEVVGSDEELMIAKHVVGLRNHKASTLEAGHHG